MTKKKYLTGGIVIALTFTAAIIFNCFVFPSALAATPDSGEVKSAGGTGITAMIQSDEETPAVTEIANMISEETALKIAAEQLSVYGGHDVWTLPHKIRLVEAAKPIGTAVWSVAFYMDDPENSNIHTIYMAAVNAMTGESRSTGALTREKNVDYGNTTLDDMLNGTYEAGGRSVIYSIAVCDDEKIVYNLETIDQEGLLVSYAELTAEEYMAYYAKGTKGAGSEDLFILIPEE